MQSKKPNSTVFADRAVKHSITVSRADNGKQPSGKDAARLFLYPHIRFPPLPLLLQKLQEIRACIPI